MVKYLPTSQAASQYIGLAKVLYARVKAKGIEVTNKPYSLDGVLYLVTFGKLVNKVIIIAEPGGFVFHPHSTNDYPLIDDDGGTRLITKETTSWDYDPKPNENYGNIDWKGEDAVLTWKGPPSRHFPLDPRQAVPGLTVLDEEVEENGLPVNYYTPFGPNIYESGEILNTLPAMGITPKVLGACYRDGVLTVMAGTNYRGMTNPAGGTGGFFYELWQQRGEWTRLGYHASSRQTVPWFFSQLGLKGVCLQDSTIYRCEILVGDTVTAEFTVSSELCTGTQTVSKTTDNNHSGTVPGNTWDLVDTLVVGSGPWVTTDEDASTFTVNRNQECIVGIDFVGEEEVVARYTLQGTLITTLTVTSSETVSAVANIPQNAPAAVTAGVSGLSATGAGVEGSTRVTGAGGCAPYTYSASNATIDATGLITAFGSCGTVGNPAFVTVTVTDSRGSTATAQIKHPSGHYRITRTFDAGCYCSGSCACDSTSHCGCQHTGSGYHVSGSGNWIGTGDYEIHGGSSGCRKSVDDYTACGSLIGDGIDPVADVCSGCKLTGIDLYEWVC